MLIEFRVENYRSFGQVQRLSMLAGSVKNNPSHVRRVGGRKVLTAAAVFGANSSGKTNLVRAMFDAQTKILAGVPIPAESWNRNDPSNRSEPTGFEFVFTSGDSVLAYGFNVIAETGEVVDEWLHDMTEGDVCLFDRHGRDVSHDWKDSSASQKLDVMRDMLRPGGGDLLLPLLARMDDPNGGLFSTARTAMDWFAGRLVILGAGMPAPVTVHPDHDEYVRNALRSYATGITGIGYERLDMLPPDVPPALATQFEQQLRKGGVGMIRSPSGCIRLSYSDGLVAERTVFDHNGARFEFNEESDGTRRLFDLLPVTERNNIADVTFVIDELDRSLHPQLTRRFIRDFLRMATGLSRQLVFTTHEVMLLELDILRRDEFWFVERQGLDSRMYSLEDFRERIDRKIIISYLDGRYGAIPVFKELYPDLE